MATPSVKSLKEWLGLDDAQAKELKAALNRWHNAYGRDSADEADEVLKLADHFMDAHGTEPIRGDYHVDGYYYDVVALYVNTGDAYSATLLYETEPERFILTTWGDWVEKNERKYRIE